MTPSQRTLIETRRRQIRYWPILALLLVGLLGSAYGWLWMHAPVNLSAELVLQQFHSRTLSTEELIMLAARGTLALVACGLFMLVIVLLVSIALWNEYRLIRILDELDPPPSVQKQQAVVALVEESEAAETPSADRPEIGGSEADAGTSPAPSPEGSDRP
ncbi:MAG TPA: hypothetical protein VFM34_01760 [Moraxellaceae bacterium]|nr:hypothetical protein [Moraxellaceae bacterium]